MKDVTIVPDDVIITHRKLDYVIDCSNNDEIVYAVEKTYRPLVLCKECKHRDPEDKKCDSGMLERQGCIFPVDDDYFCKYGERRADYTLFNVNKPKGIETPLRGDGTVFHQRTQVKGE